MNSNNSESRIKLPDIFNEKIDISDIKNKCSINYTDKIKQPPIIIELKQGNKLVKIFSYKSFSAVVGRQKSRKSFFMSLLMSCCVANNYIQTFRGLTSNKINVYFDTEQTKYEVQWLNRRIIKLSGRAAQPDNLKTYFLRSLSVQERIEFIDYIIRTTENIGFVVIDGIRDLVYDINSPHEATEIVGKVMRWSEDYNCHICNVLHLNKGQEKTLRGHLGTEVQNKAESIIEVEKDEQNKHVSIIRAKDFRGIEFEDIAMMIEDGLPVITHEYEAINTDF